MSLHDDVIPEETLWFYRRHLHNAVYDFLIRTFRHLDAADLITKARLADRIRKDRGLVTRWLSSPGNLRLNTISDLLVGMAVDPTLLVDELSVAATTQPEPQDAQPDPQPPLPSFAPAAGAVPRMAAPKPQWREVKLGQKSASLSGPAALVQAFHETYS